MLAHRKQRLAIVGFILATSALAVGLMLYAMRDGINLFFTPTEVSQGIVPVGQNFRIGGMVKAGSVDRSSLGGTLVQFITTDCVVDIPVQYTGVLPDLFREGQGVVADGYLDDRGIFQANRVLARHDENYMPAESQAALDASGGTCDT